MEWWVPIAILIATIELWGVATEYWPITLVIAVIAVAIWISTRINRLPDRLPDDAKKRATTVSEWSKTVLSLYREHKEKSDAYYALTTLQRKSKKAPEDFSKLIRKKAVGLLMHIQGTIADVSSEGSSVNVKIIPDDGRRLFSNGMNVMFSNRWRHVLAELSSNARVEIIAKMEEWKVQETTRTNGRVLVKGDDGYEWVDNDATYDSSICNLLGVSIAAIRDD